MKDPAWIEIVPQADWAEDSSLRDSLEKVKDQENGRVDHIMAVHSIIIVQSSLHVLFARAQRQRPIRCLLTLYEVFAVPLLC